MKPLIQLLAYSFLFVFLNSCGHIFEVDADVQARQALLDLMKIQEKFYQENKRYATRFGEIEKYNLKYHVFFVKTIFIVYCYFKTVCVFFLLLWISPSAFVSL